MIKIDANKAAWRRIEQELVVLDLANSSYLSVNETGTALWPSLEQGTTLDALVQVLLDEFDVAIDIARRETEVFVDQLRSRGLLIEDGAANRANNDEAE